VYVGSPFRVTVVARVFGILAVILMLVWLLHYREGLEYDSENPFRVFNVHPLLMLLGLVITAGDAMMAYRSVAATHDVQKIFHMFLNLLAICLGIIGICAVFKFHDMIKTVDVYSLHSWIGIATITLYCLQWLIGFVSFMFPKASGRTRSRISPLHAMGGRALLYMAVCAALTGLMEKATFLGLQPHQRETRLINFTGLSILLFGVFVELSLTVVGYRVNY